MTARCRFKAAESLAGFRAQLEPGDILLASPQASKATSPVRRTLDRAFAAASRYVQGSDKTHSMLYTGNGKVVETRIGSGVEHVPLKRALEGLDTVALRPAGVALKDRKAAARKALELVRSRPAYAFKGMAKALLEDAELPLPLGAVDGLICSDLITRSYDAPLTDKPRDAVLPVDFLRSTRLTQVAEHKGAKS
jgi:hypothetical protein